jgi:4-diphosphocytidyl-2C-methyl-D-erythritol kinase
MTDWLEVAIGGRNDLEAAAREIAPIIGNVIDLLAAQPGVALARMSGSGATCFALFDSEAMRTAAVRHSRDRLACQSGTARRHLTIVSRRNPQLAPDLLS